VHDDATGFDTKQVDSRAIDFEFTGNCCCKVFFELLPHSTISRDTLDVCVEGHGKDNSCLAEQFVGADHKPIRANDTRGGSITVVIIRA
jgi:hypothetical protein